MILPMRVNCIDQIMGTIPIIMAQNGYGLNPNICYIGMTTKTIENKNGKKTRTE